MSQKNLHIFAVHWSGPGVTGWAGVTDGADEKKIQEKGTIFKFDKSLDTNRFMDELMWH